MNYPYTVERRLLDLARFELTRREITQRQAAFDLGISSQHLNDVLQGREHSLPVACALVELLGIDLQATPEPEVLTAVARAERVWDAKHPTWREDFRVR